MPISSRRIITFIKSAQAPFSYNDLEAGLLKPEKGRISGRRKKSPVTHRDQIKLDHTIKALISIGFLQKKKKSYSRNPDFRIEGILQMMRSGKSVLELESGYEVFIERENLNSARHRDLVEADIIDFSKGAFIGTIRRILNRKKEEYLARVEAIRGDKVLLTLLDTPGSIEVSSPLPSKGINRGDIAYVKMTEGPREGRPKCEILNIYPPDSELQDVQRIVLKHSLPSPHGEYEELSDIERILAEETALKRKDYRKLFTVTIDGETAKDFDDAISFESSWKSTKLYVHIAGVSAFVRRGTPLDREAFKRGTSFYLGGTVIPMLPEILSNDYCSLREGVDRLTMTAEMTIDKSGEIVKSRFYRGVIRVNKRLTYNQAAEMIEGKNRNRLATLLRKMNALALTMKSHRMTRGRVDLNLSDQEIIYDGHKLVDIRFARRLPSHILIEEFMLSANEAVSRALKEKGVPTLYRIHETISEEKMTVLTRFLRTLGLNLGKSPTVGAALQEVIDSVAGREYEQVVNFIILKSFMQAYYGEHPLGHFGLGFKDYTHFTSPIRRYPDLIVHRCLKSLIDGTRPDYANEELKSIGEKSSEMERLAQNAERDLVRLKAARLMKEKVGEVFDAVISGLSKSGLFVTLLERPIEGMIPLRLMTDDYYLIQEGDYTVVGKRYGRRYRLGDKIRVKLLSVETDTMRIDFDVA